MRKDYRVAATAAERQARAEDARLRAAVNPRQEYSFTKEAFGRGHERVVHVVNENLREMRVVGQGALPDMGLGGILHVVRNKRLYSDKMDEIGTATHMSFTVGKHVNYVSISEIARHAACAAFSVGYGAITPEDRRAMARLFPAHAAQFNPREGVVPASAPTSVPVIGMTLHGK